MVSEILHLGNIPGGIQGTTWSARGQTPVLCVHSSHELEEWGKGLKNFGKYSQNKNLVSYIKK